MVRFYRQLRIQLFSLFVIDLESVFAIMHPIKATIKWFSAELSAKILCVAFCPQLTKSLAQIKASSVQKVMRRQADNL